MMARGIAVAAVAAAAVVAAVAAVAAPALTPMEEADLIDVRSLLELPTSFAAMMVCSGIFVAGLPADVVIDEDCDAACTFANVTIDYEERSVTAALKFTGGAPVKAIWRGDGVGCTVIDGLTEAELRNQDVGDQTPLPPLNDTVAWPLGNLVDLTDLPDDVDWATVNETVERDFANERYNTRAVIIVHRGRVVLERYADGIDEDTRLISWSMAKSVTSALVGILVGEDRLNVSEPVPVPEYYEVADDPRSSITLANMLNMNSGIKWNEAAGDVQCIFTHGEGDCAGWYAQRPEDVPPGTRFLYSTGNSMLLSRIVLERRGDEQWTHFEWPRQKLFKRLSMNSALIESQANTIFLGGSVAYMTARDWARLALLYLNDGVWVDGTRILPEGWVTYTKTPSATNPDYGAHWWLSETASGVPYYGMSGMRQQSVSIFESKDLIVARLAMPSLISFGGGFSLTNFLTPIADAFPDVQ